MNKLKAFHGKQEVKDFYIARVKAHRLADELVKGVYYEQTASGRVRACGVGCTVHSGDHSAYERELGIPAVIARLEDGIFEGLPNGEAKAWPERFLEAIPVGADLSLVWPRFAVWLLADERHGVIRFARSAKTRKAVNDVAALYSRLVAGETVSHKEWSAAAAAYAADAAAADAAYAAYAADADAAAAYAAAAYAADAAARKAQAAKLLDLLAKSL